MNTAFIFLATLIVASNAMADVFHYAKDGSEITIPTDTARISINSHTVVSKLNPTNKKEAALVIYGRLKGSALSGPGQQIGICVITRDLAQKKGMDLLSLGLALKKNQIDVDCIYDDKDSEGTAIDLQIFFK